MSTTITDEHGERTIRIDTPLERMEELRERSALSRLADVADGVYMCATLFLEFRLR